MGTDTIFTPVSVEAPPMSFSPEIKPTVKANPSLLKEPPKYAGHFLSIIAFNGQIHLKTTECVLLAQQEELKRTGGRAGMWQGWKFHAGEGQVRSRNECAWQMLQTPCAYHDLLDADLIPEPEHFKRMRRHPEAKDSIICGPYFKKQQKIEVCCNFLKDHQTKPTPINERGLMEISKGGTGMMSIPRNVYERIMAKFPERFYLCDYDIDTKKGTRAKRYSFFFHDIRMDHELGFMRDQSEDWAFCDLARAAGVKIYLDTTLTGENGDIPPIHHIGQTTFPLLAEMERIDAEDRIAKLEAELAKLRGEIKK